MKVVLQLFIWILLKIKAIFSVQTVFIIYVFLAFSQYIEF